MRMYMLVFCVFAGLLSECSESIKSSLIGAISDLQANKNQMDAGTEIDVFMQTEMNDYSSYIAELSIEAVMACDAAKEYWNTHVVYIKRPSQLSRPYIEQTLFDAKLKCSH